MVAARAALPTSEGAYAFLDQVKDPEVPVLSVVELGIVREVRVSGGRVDVDVTPTYSGCPAMKLIEDQIKDTLTDAGFDEVRVHTVYQPVWTTDFIGEAARKKLKAYGIAPPGEAPNPTATVALFAPSALVRSVRCPKCDGPARLTSEFGSTACKSLHFCDACREPFEHFKAI